MQSSKHRKLSDTAKRWFNRRAGKTSFGNEEEARVRYLLYQSCKSHFDHLSRVKGK